MQEAFNCTQTYVLSFHVRSIEWLFEFIYCVSLIIDTLSKKKNFQQWMKLFFGKTVKTFVPFVRYFWTSKMLAYNGKFPFSNLNTYRTSQLYVRSQPQMNASVTGRFIQQKVYFSTGWEKGLVCQNGWRKKPYVS